MIIDYKSIAVGDRVRFSWVRDPRFHPDKVEHYTGVALRMTLKGWLVRTSEVTMAQFGVNESNYVGHRTPSKFKEASRV